MSDRILAVLAILVLAGFLGILLWELRRIDLGVLIGVTLLLVIWDVLRPRNRRRD